jgi:hypothetical protein
MRILLCQFAVPGRRFTVGGFMGSAVLGCGSRVFVVVEKLLLHDHGGVARGA